MPPQTQIRFTGSLILQGHYFLPYPPSNLKTRVLSFSQLLAFTSYFTNQLEPPQEVSLFSTTNLQTYPPPAPKDDFTEF